MLVEENLTKTMIGFFYLRLTKQLMTGRNIAGIASLCTAKVDLQSTGRERQSVTTVKGANKELGNSS